MAVSSDAVVKQLLEEIGNVGKLKLRIFPEDNNSDQKPWIDGGLSFGRTDLLYGSCDCAWYVEEKWTDPINGITVNFKPIIAVEGTLALERGSTGSAQYQRFFHALGAVLSGVIGVYYLRHVEKHFYKGAEVSSKMRYDLTMAAFNASEVHKVPYLVITEIDDLKNLVEALGKNDKKKVEDIISEIMKKMKEFYDKNRPKSYSQIQNYCEGRSIAITPKNDYIKILSTNYENLTLSAKRGGHIMLGEYFIAKYMVKGDIWMLLPRLSKNDIKKLNNTDKKEWKILWYDSKGNVLTLEDFDGIDVSLQKRVSSLRGADLKNSSPSKAEWDNIVEELMHGIKNGKYIIKNDFKPEEVQKSKSEDIRKWI